MATYFHQHHHHHHNHHGNTSDIIPQQADGGLQTLILMNPNLVGYSESHAPPPSSPSPSPTSNFLFHAPTLYHAPPPLLPQLVGVPLHHSADPYQPPPSSHAQQHYAAWAHLGHMPPERDSPRAQQGLSLTLASSQNHSFARADHAEPDHFHPSPPADPTPPGCRSESPTATAASAGDVAALMTPSKYLKAAQELLEEVVNVTVDRVKPESGKMIKTKGESPPAADSVAGDGLNEERPAPELTPSEKHELQMKKAKLITLLDEVEQRQRQYHQQMQEVVGSFEQVAGSNSARTYTSLALKTISNQFRSLRGAISGQIRATNKALGEGEGEGGSTSRLRMLDHQMRQQRALQQLGMIQNNAWRPQRGLPEKAVSVLRAWLFEHFLHPYPKDSDKIMLAKRTGLTRSQVSNWFINARVRLWKPMIEEMYAEEVKEQQQQQQNGSDGKSGNRQDHQKDHNAAGDDDQAKDAAENHSSSIVGSTVSIPPFRSNPFALVDSGAHQGSSCGLKKQRMNNTDQFLSTATFPDSDLFNSGCKEEERHKQEDCSMMQGPNPGFMGGLVSYPIGEIGRFGDGQFPANFSRNNGVSLTLGLPHCESLSLQANNNGHNQAFLHSSQDIDQYRGRLEMSQLSGFGGVKPPNPSQNAYAAQLLHDFVA